MRDTLPDLRTLSIAALLLAVCGCEGDPAAPTHRAADAASETDITSVTPSDRTDPVDARPAPARLGLNDVSVLFPLPSRGDAPGYLAAADEGALGVLLPEDVFSAFPTFPVTPSQGLVYARMRVVALRFDGCGGRRDACRPEIRLVMQPINADGSARDSALHLFYELTAGSMGEVVGELRRLRDLAPGASDGPLDVHPALAAQGVEGTYGAALRALVLRHVGERNLIRVTFFLRAPPVQEVWFFGGFDRAEGEVTAMNIVGVGRGNQRVIRTEVDGGYDYNLTPVGTTPEDGRSLLTAAAAARATDAQRRAAMASFLRVQNPRRYAPDELPCAGCHVAAFVTAEATRTFQLDPADFPDDRFIAERDLTMRGAAATSSSSLRAFGWFEGEPMISQRVINDSAATADHLDSEYPAPR